MEHGLVDPEYKCDFLNKFVTYTILSTYTYHMCDECLRSSEECMGSPGAGTTWVMGPEPGSSAREANVLNCWSISPTCTYAFLIV